MRILLALLLSFVTVAHAEDRGLLPGLIAAPMLLPVRISGKDMTLDSYVIRPDRPGRFPLVIMTHGTPGGGEGFFDRIARRTPISFNVAAVALAQRGYATLSIMRRGFGRSGGGYSEGLPAPCDYTSGVRIGADDVIAALAVARNEPWVDADHILLFGHSTGGLTMLAAAERNPAGVVGILNFDGGYHSFAGPGQPCGADRLVDTAATLGRTVHVPALWLYAENDQFYGPDLARQMFAAYTSGGAPARLQILPPFGKNGHDLVLEGAAGRWLSVVEPFLAELKLPTAVMIDLPEPAALAAPPSLSPGCQRAFTGYAAQRSDAKAFAVNDRGGCGYGTGRSVAEARDNAIAECSNKDTACHVYAVGQHVGEN
ncbi:alpha/beta hydrolase [Bradyrhizobium septentrionale]|uniref:Alpha/beta hydrolase n=1 Tax=Bradyrhizobium septentrionale TaxID=1404411 RepID=A0A974A3G2_9BRAD|nr:alpha/beta hydrolase [Bradyrhizobium septentrionale]UGY15754.1 alpha/beta hydrolase [Bradyrhizobium septentrionale]UGY24330.1 alpha/beta hydrolase [Bradyrhizobium septentrionale]